MALDNFKNFARVTFSTGYNSSATTVVLSAGQGALLPTAPFNMVWWDASDYADPSTDPNVEIVRVTNIATDTLTITRAQEGTTANNHNIGSKTYLGVATLTAKTINTDIPSLLPSLPMSIADGGTGTSSTLTGLVRGNASAMTAAELSGDVTTSGSNAATVVAVNSGSIPTSAPLLGSNSSNQIVPASPFSVNPQTATYQVLASDFANYKTIVVSSGSFTVTLVASGSQPANGQFIDIVNYGNGTVTVSRSGQNINGGSASVVIPPGTAVTPSQAEIISDGSNYFATLSMSQVPLGSNVAGVLPVANGGTGTGTTLTGLMRGNSSAMTATELSGDATTSGSNVVSVVKVNGGSIPASAPFVGTNSSNQIILSQPFGINAQSATYQVLAADFANYATIVVSSGSFTITLVAFSSQPPDGQFVTILNTGAGTVTVAPSGQNINGSSSSFTIRSSGGQSNPGSAQFFSDGSNYWAPACEGNAVRGYTGLSSNGYVPYVSNTGTLSIDATPGLFWDSTNHRLGVGTASPQTSIDTTGTIRTTGMAPISGGSGTGVEILYNTSAGYGHIYAFDIGVGSEPLYIDGSPLYLNATSTSNVGVGTNTPTCMLTVSSNISSLSTPPTGAMVHIANADGDSTFLTLDSFQDSNSVFPSLAFRQSNGTNASPTASVSLSSLGAIEWYGYNGSAYALGVALTGTTEQLWSGTAQGTTLSFYTTPASTTTLTKQMVLTSAGYLGIGNTSPTYPLVVQQAGNSTIQCYDSTNTRYAYLCSNVNTGLTGPGIILENSTGYWSFLMDSSNNLGFTYSSAASTELLTLSDTGYLGIGQPTPAYPIDILAPSSIDAAINIVSQGASLYSYIAYQATGHTWQTAVAGSSTGRAGQFYIYDLTSTRVCLALSGSTGAAVTYAGVATTANGLGSFIGSVNATAQSANISSTNLVASLPANGMYIIHVVAYTTAGGGTGTFPELQFGYTCPDSSLGSVTLTAWTATANPATGLFSEGNYEIYAESGTAITYVTSGGSYSTMRYSLHINVEWVG